MILGQLHAVYFGAVVISAVTADVVAHLFEGDLRAFPIPEYTLVSPWELPLYAVLGVLAAIVAVLFTRSLYFSEDVWDKLKFPEYLKPVLGGLLLGVLGIMSPKILGYPRIFGVGYATITEVIVWELSPTDDFDPVDPKIACNNSNAWRRRFGRHFRSIAIHGCYVGRNVWSGYEYAFPRNHSPTWRLRPGRYGCLLQRGSACARNSDPNPLRDDQ